MIADSLRLRLFRITSCVVVMVCLAGQVAADGQQPSPSPPPDSSVGGRGRTGGAVRVPTTPQQVRPAPAPAQAREQQPTSNIQLDLVITDTLSGKPVKKTVTMIARSGMPSSIRTSGMVQTPGSAATPVQLNLDARASEQGNRSITVNATLEFTPVALAGAEATAGVSPPNLQQSINVLLRSGKPLLVSRSADPFTDRTVTVEMTATILDY